MSRRIMRSVHCSPSAIVTLACLVFGPPGAAQRLSHKEPVFYSGSESATAPNAIAPGLRWKLRRAKEFKLAPLTVAETARLREPSDPPRLGLHRPLSSQALAAGMWDALPDGGRVWRMSIRSPGSAGIRVLFTDFAVGQGRVWLHREGGAEDEIAGPYTDRGIFADGQFWSGMIWAEAAIIEYEPEPGRPAVDIPPFRIETISHRSGDRAAQAPENLSSALSTLAASSLTNQLPSLNPAEGTSDRAAACELDPNCYPQWQDSMKMVAEILFEDEGGHFECSASLVATRDNSFKPYLLTAGHCIHNEASARSVQAYWSYQTQTCGGEKPATRGSVQSQGAHYLASGSLSEGDFSLMLLNGVPSGVGFAGWDLADPPVGTPLVGLHHPSASYKRISFGQRATDATVQVESDILPGNLFYQVLWTDGRVEHGSSGSPLFNGPGVIVGMLSYGQVSSTISVCDINPNFAGYGRFSNAYPYLRDYLEDLPFSAVSPAPAELRFKALNGTLTAPVRQAVRLNTKSAGAVNFKARADALWIRISNVAGIVSSTSPATLDISIDLKYLAKSGNYQSTITITSGAAPPQFITVRAAIAIENSTVVASISPTPSYEQDPDADGFRWFFNIQLAEKAGVATKLTSLRINGTDYSKSIAEWFGTDRIEASGTIEANVKSQVAVTPSDQYVEFSGVDEGSGHTWFKTAVVTLLPKP